MIDQAPEGRLIVGLTAHDSRDPGRLLRDIADVSQSAAQGPSPPRTVSLGVLGSDDKDGELQEMLRGHLKAILEEANAKVRASTAAIDKKRVRDQAEQKALEDGLRAYLLFLSAESIRVTVEVYEASIGAVSAFFKKAF